MSQKKAKLLKKFFLLSDKSPFLKLKRFRRYYKRLEHKEKHLLSQEMKTFIETRIETQKKLNWLKETSKGGE